MSDAGGRTGARDHAGAGRAMGARAARRGALDVLYEADLLDQDIEVVLARRQVQPAPDTGPLEPSAVELIEGVARRRTEVDERIGAAARNWTVARMPLVDRNVLRLGAFELMERSEVPTAVVLNEAVELAKLLSTPESGRFVNGVLAAVARSVRPDEASGASRDTERDAGD